MKDSLSEITANEKVAEFRELFKSEQKDVEIANLNEQTRLKDEQKILKIVGVKYCSTVLFLWLYYLLLLEFFCYLLQEEENA